VIAAWAPARASRCRARPHDCPGRFDHALVEAYERRAPNLIAEHAWRIAQSFAKFYAACPILTPQPPERASRLALATLVPTQLELALDLLGIEVPERM